MRQYPKVNIIVLNYNGKAVLENCLASLFRVNYSNFEVVVVDNASIDGSLEAARQRYPKFTFIKNDENLGYAGGNNVGIKYSLERMADFVLLLNNDTEVDKNFLSLLVAAAEVDSKIGVLSSLIFFEKSENVWFSGGKIDWWRMNSPHKKDLIEKDYVLSDFISGCAMMVRAEVFKKIGLLDEDFFLYWGDTDFGVRAKKAGFSLAVVAKSIVYHFEKSEERKANKIYWLVFLGLLFFKKNTPKYFKLWIWFYTFLRKTKNWNDLRKNKDDEMALAVRKAYEDFGKTSKS